MLALCFLIIEGPSWPRVVDCSEGSGFAELCLQQCWIYGAVEGGASLGLVGHHGAALDAGAAAVSGCQRSALCCNCLRSFVAPGKPESTAGASRR